jgi:hypothetical protein
MRTGPVATYGGIIRFAGVITYLDAAFSSDAQPLKMCPQSKKWVIDGQRGPRFKRFYDGLDAHFLAFASRA